MTRRPVAENDQAMAPRSKLLQKRQVKERHLGGVSSCRVLAYTVILVIICASLQNTNLGSFTNMVTTSTQQKANSTELQTRGLQGGEEVARRAEEVELQTKELQRGEELAGRAEEEVVTTTISSSCELEPVVQHWNSMFPLVVDANNLNAATFPWTSQCLKDLIDQYPDNLELRVIHLYVRHPERMQQQQHQVNANGSNTPTRYLFYECIRMCGGIGDRIRGMSFAFILAMATDAHYASFNVMPPWAAYFDITSPLDQSQNFLHRYRHNLMTTDGQSFLLGNTLARPFRSTSSKIQFCEWHNFNAEQMINRPQLYDGILTKLDFSTELFGDRTTTTTTPTFCKRMGFSSINSHSKKKNNNNDNINSNNSKVEAAVAILSATSVAKGATDLADNPHLNETLHDLRLLDLGAAQVRYMYIRLFLSNRLTPYFQEAVDPYLKALEPFQHVIGVQVRLGSGKEAQMTWQDPFRHPFACVYCLVDEAYKQCQEQQQHEQSITTSSCALWVTSDSEAALEAITKYVQEKYVDELTVFSAAGKGSITHIDRPEKNRSPTKGGDEVRDDNLRTFIDWYVLAQASDSFAVSASGFSGSAALFRNVGMKGGGVQRKFKQLVGYEACKFRES